MTVSSRDPLGTFLCRPWLTNVLDVILSLVRTSRVGYLRDIRRLTVALSRARLGLYIVGRRDVFESSYELKPAFDVLLKRPDKLSLVTSEMYPTRRALTDEPASTEMESTEHLGAYVYEMTKAKVEAIKANGGKLPEMLPEENTDDEDDDGVVEEFDEEPEDLEEEEQEEV